MKREAMHSRDVFHSLKWVLFWMGLSLLCGVGILTVLGREYAVEYLGCYLIELSLSVDNLFVFITIFMSFGIKEHAQHKVLNYGIAGAIILRFVFIMMGARIVNSFHFVLYLFGVILIISGLRMFLGRKGPGKDAGQNKAVKLLGKFIPMTNRLDGEKFFTVAEGRRMATPLFAAVVVIECTDILFAVDSVPAAFSFSTHPFIIYAANMFAILGLRQLYFVLEHLHERFAHVKYGVAAILTFTGVKLGVLFFDVHIPTWLSIGFIFFALAGSILLSLAVTKGRRS